MANEFSYDKGVNTIPTGSRDGFVSYDGSLISTDGIPIPARSQMGYKTGEKKVSVGIARRIKTGGTYISTLGYVYRSGFYYNPGTTTLDASLQTIARFKDSITIPIYMTLSRGAIVKDLILVAISSDGKRISSYGFMNSSTALGERKNAGWDLTNEINGWNAPSGYTFERFIGYSVNQYLGTKPYGNPTFAVQYNENNAYMFVGAINGQTGAAYTQKTDVPINIVPVNNYTELNVFMFPLGPENDFIGVISATGISPNDVPNYFKVFINTRIVYESASINTSTYPLKFRQCFMIPTYINNKLGLYIEAALVNESDAKVRQNVALRIEYPGANVSVVSKTFSDNMSYLPVGSIIESDTNITTFLAKVKKDSYDSINIVIEKYIEGSISPVMSKEVSTGLNKNSFLKMIDTVVNYENNKKVYMFLYIPYNSQNTDRYIVINKNASTPDNLIEKNQKASSYGSDEYTINAHVFSDLLSRG